MEKKHLKNGTIKNGSAGDFGKCACGWGWSKAIWEESAVPQQEVHHPSWVSGKSLIIAPLRTEQG